MIVQRYLKGFTLTLAGSIAGQGTSFLALAITARFLGAESFGRFGAVQGALIAAFSAGTLGLGITATRYVTKYRTANSCKLGRILGLSRVTSAVSGIVFMMALALAANPLAVRLLNAPELEPLIRNSAPYCALMTLNAYQSGVLLGFEAYRRLARVQIVQGLSFLGSSVALTALWGLQGAVLALPVSAAITCIFSSFEVAATCREFRVRIITRNCWTERHIFSGFAVPATVSSWVGTAAIWMAQALLVRSSAGIIGLGLWTAACTARTMVLFAPGLLNRVSGPILSSLRDDGDTSGYQRTLWMSTLGNTIAALTVAGVLVLLHQYFLEFLGRDFARANAVLPLVLIAAVVESYAFSVYQAIFVDGRMKYQLGINFAWAGTLLVSGILLVPPGGARGLAISYIAAWVVSAIGYTGVALALQAQAAPSSERQIKSSSVPDLARTG